VTEKENRVVQGRMVTPGSLAELIEGESVMDAEPIEDADRECPDCGGSVLTVGYMPSVTAFVTGYKCQDCDWSDTERA
jgi:DNA-directed RNA polymerase subunit RPC12/RpoP